MPLDVTLTARQEIVAILVDDKLSQLANDLDFARHVLTRGFPGFSNMSASQLNCMVCDAGLDLHEGMGLLLHKLAHENPAKLSTAPLASQFHGQDNNADPLKALAQEIRYFFKNEASSPELVRLMLNTLGPQANSVHGGDDFKGLDTLTAGQLRRLVPVKLAIRERIQMLLSKLERPL